MEEIIVKKTVLCFVVLAVALTSLTALAATRNGVSTSKDGRQTIATKGHSVASPSNLPPKANFIYNNLSTYPLGRYWCCSGWTISGPTSLIGATYADGMPFTPAANATITNIAVSIGYVTGTNGATVTVNADSGGLPGTVLGSFNLSNMPTFGDCCVYDLVNAVGVPVTAGTQYWVVVATGADTQDTWAAWSENDTNETAQPFAFYNNGVWEATEGDLGGFAVVGH